MKRIIQHCRDRIIATDPMLVLIWFPWYWKKGPAIELRKALGRYQWREETVGVREHAMLIIKSLLWPLIALTSAALLLNRNARSVRTEFGIQYKTQLRDLARLSFLWGIAPDHYYWQRLYTFDLSKHAGDVITVPEIIILTATVEQRHFRKLVNHKYLFYKFCIQHDIQTLPLIASFEAGRCNWITTPKSIPHRTLYFKPNIGCQGRGIERWSYDSQLEGWRFGKRFLKESTLLEEFLKKSETEDYVLQEAIGNHPALAPFSESGLLTFRLVTFIDSEGEPQLSSGDMYIPVGDAIVNHSTHGGLNSSIDLETGKLTAVIARVPELRRYERHPHTGAQVDGVELEILPELIALVLKGQRALPLQQSIGWDVVYTQRGAEVVEGNTRWATRPGKHLGNSTIMESMLKALPAELKK